ncbi:MAG: hypothetical protein E7335_09685 [Clostridiales bacterium]|nr:hypothetical protein [Clostridiales bacterium]
MKKLWIAALILCFALCAAAFAEGSEYTLSGEGTEEKPYLISTKEDLLHLAALMNEEGTSHFDYWDAHFLLTADIALNDCSDFAAWDENPPEDAWTPIAYRNIFKGVFDGNGHTISGLYINQAVGKDGYGYGLFGTMGGEVRNLTITDAFIHPRYVEGQGGIGAGILAASNTGLISGCSVNGVVICEEGSLGGIAGRNNGEIVDCTFDGKIVDRCAENGKSHSSIVGGIAGSGGNIRNCSVSAQFVCEKPDGTLMYADMGGIVGMLSAFREDEYIENCSFTGEINSGETAGGIVGYAGSIGKADAVVRGIIRGCTNSGSVTAKEDAGGIVGDIGISSDHEIWVDSCINKGEVRTLGYATEAAGGIVGYIDIRNTGTAIVSNCTNEAELSANMPGGIVGRIMQSNGNVRIEKCINNGAINGEIRYAAGILCHIQQWGDNWNIVIDQCINEADITTVANAGGIVCFAFDADAKASGRSLTISDCINRGNLRSGGINNYMGGILGVNALAKVPVNIVGCVNEGDLEYTSEVLVDRETLSGTLVTLARTSGGIVGHVGTAPYFSVNSGEHTVNNINTENAYLTIANCASTGKFIHKEARFADDVDEVTVENWKKSGYDNVLNFFVSLEGGIVGTVADEGNYSVRVVDCTYENVEREIDDWNRYSTNSNR